MRQFKERTRLSSRNSRASYIQRKEARELREDERRYSRPVRYLRCWDKKVQLRNRTYRVGGR